MSIVKQLDKNNLHHAYLIEAVYEDIRSEIKEFWGRGKDFELIEIRADSFKIEDARNLKSYASEKGFLGKKIFLISANSILLEAQNSMLKIFEEPIPDTHFFVVVPDASALLKTLLSRFYFISARQELDKEKKEAEKFIAMPLKDRIEFLKDLLAETDEENGEENAVVQDSARSKALRFLNALEFVLHKNTSTAVHGMGIFDHIFKVRELLRMPGSSAKILMESVALIIPEKK